MSSAPPPPPPDSGTPPSQPAAAPPRQATAAPPPQAAAAPPPPPPPPGPAFDAGGQARVLFSQLDPTGWRPTLTVAGIILALFFGSQLLNAVIPVSAVGPGVPGPGPAGPGPAPTTGPGPGPTSGPGPGGPGPGPLTTAPPPGSTLTVGPLLIPLENGWVPQEVPGTNVIVRLAKGSVAIDVIGGTLEGQATAAEVYVSYMNDMAGVATGFGAAQPSAIQIGNGIPAARGSYTGVFGQNQIEGDVTAMVIGGNQAWIFDVWAPGGTLRTLLPEAQRMIDNTLVE